MRTVELLDQALDAAMELGYRVRHEWLGGSGGGACEFGGRRWIFIDLALSAEEQLEQVGQVLRSDPGVHLLELSSGLRRLLDHRRVA